MLLYMSEFLMNRYVPGIYRTYCRLTLTVGMGMGGNGNNTGELCKIQNGGMGTGMSPWKWEVMGIPSHSHPSLVQTVNSNLTVKMDNVTNVT